LTRCGSFRLIYSLSLR
ncbi:DTW domain protein, partial [Vibrio harveyi]